MNTRLILGLLAPRLDRDIRKQWNDVIREEGIDGFFDFYRTTNRADLELRLSEMFHLERRGYVIDSSLQTIIVPLLDRLDTSTVKKGGVDTIVNERGVLVGYFLGKAENEKRLDLWMQSGEDSSSC